MNQALDSTLILCNGKLYVPSRYAVPIKDDYYLNSEGKIIKAKVDIPIVTQRLIVKPIKQLSFICTVGDR